MKSSDISDAQVSLAAECLRRAFIELREERGGRYWDDDFRNLIDDILFRGRRWRSYARIRTVEDAKREILSVAEQLESLRA